MFWEAYSALESKIPNTFLLPDRYSVALYDPSLFLSLLVVKQCDQVLLTVTGLSEYITITCPSLLAVRRHVADAGQVR